METIVPIIKYIFVIAVSVEIGLILRALVALARAKARVAMPPTHMVEE